MDFATPQVFANAKDEPDDADPKRGQKLEFQMYEARYNSEGKRVTLHAGTKKSARTPADVNEESALLVTRYYDRHRELEYTEMEVRSPYIRAALRAVIKKYPGLTFDAGKILIRDEPKCIFHYRDALRDYGMDLHDQTAAQHLVFFLTYMYNSLSREISSYYAFMASPTVKPGIEHEFLWMAFKPGTFILHTVDGIHRILRFSHMSLSVFSEWNIWAEKIVYDGEDYGYTKVNIRIPWYDGYKPLQELRTYPLDYHELRDDILDKIINRGPKFVSLREPSHRCYSGVANSLSPYRINSIDGEEDEYPIQSIMIKGRIMVDCKRFGAVRPTHKHYIPQSEALKTNIDGEPMIEDDEWCLFDSQITGFSLSAKRWCYFELDRIIEFEYNSRAFESLVLENDQKAMLSSLVRVHSEDLQFDDLVKGKGKGLIFLLHGEPGVGKTLTAESLADYTKRPLYFVSSGDLGTTATDCERALVEILDLATHWNAVLLIDEADVLLEQRSQHDLVRNGVVSVWLRLLEYFEGIMFLTTNRIINFDLAFKSRIHLAIKYPALSPPSQRQLWVTFITNDGQHTKPHWLNDGLLDTLATKTLNGRQIKNVVRIAVALAVAARRDLHPRDIHTSLKAMRDFDRDFSEAMQEKHTMSVLDHSHDGDGYTGGSASGSSLKRRRLE